MGFTEAEFNVLVRGLYRGVRQVPFEQFHDFALKLIKPVLKFDMAIWGMAMHAERGTVVSSFHLHELPPAMMEEYARVQKLDYVAGKVAANLGQTVLATLEDPELTGKVYAPLCAFKQKYGLANLLSTALPEPTLGLGHFLTLFRSDPAHPFTETDRQFKECLFPHLVEALMLARCLYMKKEGGAKQGYAVADNTLYLASIAPVFKELMTKEWPTWIDSRMPPEVCAVWTGKPHTYYRGKRIFITLEPDQQLVHIAVRARNAIDALTEKEFSVARLYANGLEKKEIATALGNSVHTVDNHIRSIFEKLGVGDKVKLSKVMDEFS